MCLFAVWAWAWACSCTDFFDLGTVEPTFSLLTTHFAVGGDAFLLYRCCVVDCLSIGSALCGLRGASTYLIDSDEHI